MTLILELVDLVKILQDQIGKKRELDNSLLTNYVVPIWEIFTQIHEDYLSTFQMYFKLLNTKNFKIDSLIDTIKLDSAQASKLRSDLFNHLDAINSSSRKKVLDRLEFQSFIASIRNYFSLNEYLPFSFNQVSEHEWLFLSYSSESYFNAYQTHEEVWKFSKSKGKNNKLALEILYQKIPKNGKVSLGIDHTGSMTIRNTKDYSSSIIPTTNEENQDNKALIEWGKEITKLLISPFANNPRVVILSALILNEKTSKKDLSNFLAHILSILQERYDIVSKNYYELRIRALQ